MPDWLQTYLQSFGANQPVTPMGAPSYGIGPGVLGMADPMRMTGVPGAPSMGYPAMGRPAAPSAPQTNDQLGSYVGMSAGAPAPTAMPWRGPIANQPTTNISAPAPAIPPPRPKGKIDPKTVDLGMNRRFVPIQYQVPSGRGPLGNNPIYTALNLGGGQS